MKAVTKFNCIAFTLTLALLLSSCVSLPNTNGSYLPPELETEETIDWKQVAPDVVQFDYKSAKMDYHIVKINLNAKWHIDSYPHTNQWVRPKSVKSFAKENNSTVAINTNPFLFTSKIIWWSKIKPIGTCRENYVEYSEINPKYCALAFFEEEDGTLRAEIYDSQNEIMDKNPYCSFGGFFTIYRDGKFYDFKEINDVRSAAAVSDNGKILYLFVGKNLSFPDCARIFANLGVQAAMEFDGGSSSQMTVNKKYAFVNIPPRNIAAIFGLKPIH